VSAETILFFVFSICTLAGASLVILARNPITSAMSLVATFFFLAGIYVLMFAHVLAALQIIVYAGAVVVLFLLVIMLLSLKDLGPAFRLTPTRWLGIFSSVAILSGLLYASTRWHETFKTLLPPGAEAGAMSKEALEKFGTLETIGLAIYTQWLFPFEALSLLLLAAILGAVVVAKERI
jgi:NADH-quinone oxidoreductase subunit J